MPGAMPGVQLGLSQSGGSAAACGANSVPAPRRPAAIAATVKRMRAPTFSGLTGSVDITK
jgi:hypothetical protein